MSAAVSGANPPGLKERVLLVDIGNTNLKFCWQQQSGLTPVHAACHLEQSPEQLAATLWQTAAAPGAVYLASVAAQAVADGVISWVRRQWAIEAVQVRSVPEVLGVRNGYRQPAQLGVDRWLTLIAVHNRWQRAACIVDCGTAVTVDVIDAQGLHQGGLILPGLGLMRAALLQRTHVPKTPGKWRAGLLGTDTAGAIELASIHSVAALVERVTAHYSEQWREPPMILLTGSDAAAIEAEITQPSVIEPDLVMQGLGLLAGR